MNPADKIICGAAGDGRGSCNPESAGSAEIVGDPFAVCACITVKYKPMEVGGGLMRERWICTDCGREFIKKPNARVHWATEKRL